MKPPTEVELAWAAGFIDGEGSIRWRDDGYGGRYYLEIRVGQNDPAPLHLLQELFGGSVYGPYKGAKTSHWIVFGIRASTAWELIEPYCVVKSIPAQRTR